MTNERAKAHFEAALAFSKFDTFTAWQEASGVQRSTFHNIRAGRRQPQVSTALAIARAAGLTVEQCFGAWADWKYGTDHKLEHTTERKEQPHSPQS